jgi:hypothetical protein
MAEATYSIGLVVEAAADWRAATTLIDRCLLQDVDWLESEHLPDLRSWRGIEPGTGYTEWTHAKTLAREHRVAPPGFFDGKPGKEDARAARKALLLFRKFGMPDLVVLVRDADDKPTRRLGLEQARNGTPEAERIVIGVADPEREAWIIGGFVPCDDRERSLLASERQRLGVDPTLRPHELHGNDKHSAKTALTNLIAGDRDREHRCLTERPLAELCQRGEQTGLKAFIDEIHERIVPMFGHRHSS